MNDDFNTPRAIAVLFDLSRELNAYLNSADRLHKPFLEEVNLLYQQLGGDVLGLIPKDLEVDTGVELQGSIEKIIQITIDIRNELRKEKMFKLADQIRDRLGEIGIILIDKPEGTTYEFKEKK